MTLYDFEKMIATLREVQDRRHAVHKLGVNLLEYDDPHFSVINQLLTVLYGEEGFGCISWFCYENDFGRGTLAAYDKDGNEICKTVEGLYQFLEEMI